MLVATTQVKVWTKLIGTSGNDVGRALTTGSDGSIYVSGYTSGNLDGETNSGGHDAFLTKYGVNGIRAWTKLIGTSGYEGGSGLTTGSDGSIYVSGSTYGNLDGETKSANSGSNAFLTKYDANGIRAWTKLIGITDYGSSGCPSSNGLRQMG